MDLKGKGSNCERLIPASEMKEVPRPPYQESVPVQLPDGDWLDLPLLPLPPDFDTAIAFLCSNQTTFEVEDRLTTEMAKLAKQWDPEVVIGMPTLGMVYAPIVARKLGMSAMCPWAIPVNSGTKMNYPCPLHPSQVPPCRSRSISIPSCWIALEASTPNGPHWSSLPSDTPCTERRPRAGSPT